MVLATLVALFSVVALVGGTACRAATDEADFFRGRTIRIVVGAGPGGGYDRHARLVARHLGRHLAGNPSVIVTNMPGAGGLVAATHVVSGAPADGLTIGLFMQPPAADPRERGPDIRGLAVLGSPAPLTPVCLFTRTSGITDISAWRTASRPPRIGATGPGGVTYWVPRMLQEALALPLDIVSGYTGSPEIRLGLQNGEIDGACLTSDVLDAGWREDMGLVPVLRAGTGPTPGFDHLPDAITIAASNRARSMLRVGIQIRNMLGRFYAVADRVPAPRVARLREALQRALADPALLREAAGAALVIAPVPAEELERSITELLSDHALLAEVTAILAGP